MTPAETRQVAELHTNIAALLNAIASWRQECEAVQQHYREAVARADKAEARVRELEAMIAAGGAA
jgi:flagellar biosynthesis chaperone FliJ